MLVTLSYYLDKRRMRENKESPVKLRVYCDGQPQLYQTKIELSEADFKKLNANHVKSDLQAVKLQLKNLKERAEKAIEKIEPFSFGEFELKFVQHEEIFIKKYLKVTEQELSEDSADEYIPEKVKKRLRIFDEKTYAYGTLANIMQAYITKLLLEERVGTAECYDTSFRAFKKFKGNVPIKAVTKTYLMQFERWMLRRGCSKTTIGIYLRNMRAIFNEAIDQGIVLPDLYPFGKKKYRIPTGRNIKKAIPVRDLQRIYNYPCDPDNISEQKAKDFWLFSYFINGINVADIVKLRYKNIHGDFIIYERAKTERTLREDPVLIKAVINDDVRRIIAKWGNKDKSPDNYIFPILNPASDAYEQHNQKKLFLRLVNDWLEHIKTSLQLDRKLTTYVARHTFSTVMKNSGASIRFIQEALGHQAQSTTENYMDGFDDETNIKWAANLELFKSVDLP